jgi:bis(5'-adenosyl)-triphosphatase
LHLESLNASKDVLVITKRHTRRFQDLTLDEVADLFQSAQTIGKVIEKEYGATSLTMAMQVYNYAFDG